MLSYVKEVREKDLAARRRFVVFGTTVTFIVIVAVWVPVRIAQWKSTGRPVIAEQPTPASFEQKPLVAGDQIEKRTTPTPEVTATPSPLFESSTKGGEFAPAPTTVPEESPTASATPTDFPTL